MAKLALNERGSVCPNVDERNEDKIKTPFVCNGPPNSTSRSISTIFPFPK